MNKIVLRFPFPVRQVDDRMVEVTLDTNGIPLPCLEPGPTKTVEDCERALGLDRSEHERIIDEANVRYVNALVRSAIKVERVIEHDDGIRATVAPVSRY